MVRGRGWGGGREVDHLRKESALSCCETLKNGVYPCELFQPPVVEYGGE